MEKQDLNHYARSEIEAGKKNPMSFTLIVKTSREFEKTIQQLNKIIKSKNTKMSMFEKQFTDEIDKVGDLYEGLKDCMHMLNGHAFKFTDENQKVYDKGFADLTELRDIACVNIKRKYFHPEPVTNEFMIEQIRKADPIMSKITFELNKHTRDLGDPDMQVLQKEVYKLINELAYGIAGISEQAYLQNLQFIAAQ